MPVRFGSTSALHTPDRLVRCPLLAGISLFALVFPRTPFGVEGSLPAAPDPGGVLRRLSIASFPGSGQNSIQAIATDSGGSVYVAGTTSSPDLPVKNAAQPAFAESRILRTADLGATWTRVPGPLDIAFVFPDPVAPQILFGGGNQGIYKSVDSGQTWKIVYPLQPGFNGSLAIDPGNHLRLAAIPPSGGIIRSLDEGETWSAGGSLAAQQLIADPTGSGALLAGNFLLSISRDWGLTFQQLHPPGPGGTSAVAFDPSHPGWIYVDTAAGVLGTLWLSTDYGATWTQKASPPTTFSGMLNLAVDPDQPATLLAATPDGLYKSADGAASWTRQSGPGSSFLFEGYYPFALLRHSCTPSGGLFALGSSIAGSYQVAFSPDDGITWMTPQLTSVTGVVAGPGCAVYATRQATTDAFVARIATDGTPLWTTFLGGSDRDAPVALVLDAQANAYVIGNTTSPDFPSTVPRIGVPGEASVFVAKFSPDGRVIYSVLVSGEANNTATAIAVDSSQNAYLVGHTSSLSFPVTPGALVTTLDSGSYTGFLLKLSSGGTPVYSTYLGESYTFPGAVLVDANQQVTVAGTGPVPGLPLPSPGSNPVFVMTLAPSGSQVVSSIYLDGAASFPLGPSALAADAQNNLFVAGEAAANFPVTPGAYAAPQSPASCLGNDYDYNGPVFVAKLAAADWKPVYSALLTAPCGIQPGALAVDSAGAAVLALSTGAGLPLHSPLLAGPTCSYNSSAVAKISPDGSALEFATYLDNCGVPGIALAPDGSFYAGVSPNRRGGPAGLLHLGTASAPGISLDQISNAFSGDASAVVAGGLYSLSGTGFSPPGMDLGLTAGQKLPLSLGGVEVMFDGAPAALLQTSPGRVMVVPPSNRSAGRHGEMIHGFTAVELFSGQASSNIVWMPVSESLPGLLTVDFPNLLPHPDFDFADGNVRNQDGNQNDQNHPAAPGDTITLFVTGVGAATPLYSTWQLASPAQTPPPETVTPAPGFIPAVFQVGIEVPASSQNLGGTAVGNGVQRVLVGLQFHPSGFSNYPPASNLVGVYVK